jgi:DNA-binding CsgD family transcriptional regulator
MEALGERDVHRALDVVATAAATARRAAFGIETVDAILEAIPADAAAYVEWRFGDRTSCRRAIPEEPVRRSRDAAVGIRARAKALADRSARPAQYFELGRGPGPDFDERDRSVLSLLRPHLARLRSRCERRPHLPALTERELDVLALVARSLTNRQISRRLFISPATVRTHLEHIYDKLGVGSRAGAVSAAFRIAS